MIDLHSQLRVSPKNSSAERRSPSLSYGGERRQGDAQRIDDVLKKRGRITLRVHGTSMLPWVRPGDIALIRKATKDSVRCGDLILFRRAERLFVHRIVEKRGTLEATEFLAKGDAHPTSDGFVGSQELLGRVVRLYRGNSRIDLDTPGQLALGLFVSQLSLHSRFWYPIAKAAATLSRPARRLFHALRLSTPVAR